MDWHYWLSESMARGQEESVKDQAQSCLGPELIHSLHLTLDSLRQAMATDRWSSEAFVPLLNLLRELFDAKVAALQVLRPTGEFFSTSAEDMFLKDWVTSNRNFGSLCECLFDSSGPLLVADGLEGADLSDPQLRQEFPSLSIMKGAWHLPQCDVSFLFFSPYKKQFTSDEIAILDYLRSRLLHGFYLRPEQEDLPVEVWRGEPCSAGHA